MTAAVGIPAVLAGRSRWAVAQGNALAALGTMPDACVQCVVTSPPYWGLRSYLPPEHADKPLELGLESTPEEYVARLVEILRETRRVLRDDGVLWLNLGDCYATGAGRVGNHPGGGVQGAKWRGGHEGKHAYAREVGPATQPNRLPLPGLKPKDLVGIPWRVAFALQADGWWLRSDVVWSKPNPMPESITDRPTKAHEYVFLLTKSERYFYDYNAAREPATYGSRGSHFVGGKTEAGPSHVRPVGHGPRDTGSTMRNARSVWTIPSEPFEGSHFAVMPTALVKRCVVAGSMPGDVVLDPFGGSGTVGQVALELNRRAILVELNAEYLPLIHGRCKGPAAQGHIPFVTTPESEEPEPGIVVGGGGARAV